MNFIIKLIANAIAVVVTAWILGDAIQLNGFSTAIIVALVIIFLLGIMLGRLSKEFWLWTGLRTLAIAGLTILLISSF